jgi:uncharacterized membrane protein
MGSNSIGLNDIGLNGIGLNGIGLNGIGSSSDRSQGHTIEHLLNTCLRLCLIGGVVVLASVTGFAAIASASGLFNMTYALQLLDEHLPGIFRLHMLTSGLGLILLPWVLLLRRNNAVHRILGRVAASLLLVGIVASLPTSVMSEALPVTRLGFVTQGALTLTFLIKALMAIGRGDSFRHTRAMQRASALLLSVIVLRILVSMAGSWPMSFATTYAVIAWVSWAVPLAAIELWLRRGAFRLRVRHADITISATAC